MEISLIVYLFLFRDMKERINILYLCGYVYLAAVVTTDFFLCRKCGRNAEKSCRFFYKWTVVYSVLILAWGIGLNYLELLSGRSEIVFFTIVTICAGGVNLHKRESFLLFPLTILFNYVMELTIGNQPFDLGFLVNYTIFGITLLFISLTKNKSLINETEKAVQLESNALKLKAAVEELNEANKKLRKMSVTDALTGIGNRNALHEYLLKKLSDCREKKRALCVIMSDLDDFKRINDTFGHKAGDETLKQAANIFVQAGGREPRFPVRRGGIRRRRRGGQERLHRLGGKATQDGFSHALYRKKARADRQHGTLLASCPTPIRPRIAASFVPTKRCIRQKTEVKIASASIARKKRPKKMRISRTEFLWGSKKTKQSGGRR